MVNTDTMNTAATVAQAIRIIEAGGDYVRITAPGVREAEHLSVIKRELRRRGYRTPLIADIHFNPKAAETAARVVEKVRINPGNYIDRKRSVPKDYSDSEYAAELERMHERLLPLIRICKEYGTAVRIGSNHGSLSDRVVNRYGDTPEGMVESAMEFLRIFEAEQFREVVVSMKASNVRVAIDSTRLLAQRLARENMPYPLHLGVTEAGEGEDGRVKSALGIGALLLEGVGDTVRVSLTEAPEAEIPVAKQIVRYCTRQAVAAVSMPEMQTLDASDKIVWIREDYRPPEKITALCPPFRLPDNMQKSDLPVPVLKKIYPDSHIEDIYVKAACDFGVPLLNGVGEGIWIETPAPEHREKSTDIALSLLQACRLRMSKPEYISCPSCGRTLFDLQATAARIREKTAHLKGLKIAVMGCIVNGPGEMADADYGYVGSGVGKVTLYRQREAVKRNIPEADAVDELLRLIGENDNRMAE
jgi:(E)-4-hydroxy-3-methylbut-2-enyl-diphosphate synthase